ncbi:MAG: DUF192 domain-containing protein [Candidatus Aminicenantes bacterium]|nr:DUF192 domain-containing protein [Candidatus Aminicenantes bacterium]
MKNIIGIIGVGAAVGTFLFCAPQGTDKFVKVYFPDGRSVTAELAISDAERAQGLMYREKIGADQGMLFCFPEEDYHAFWMKNTIIALDMLWLDKDRRIVHIEKNVPPCKEDPCPSYPPSRPGSYVLELGAGGADLYNLKLFDRLDFQVNGIKQ